MSTASIRWRSADSGVATLGPLALAFWGGAADRELLPSVHRVSTELGRTYPDGIAHVNLIESARPIGITDESRAGMLALMRDTSIPLVASVVVMPGEGFLAAMVRSALAGASLMARSPTAIRFVETPHAAETFLLSSGGHGKRLRLTPGTLVPAIEQLRRQLAPKPAS